VDCGVVWQAIVDAYRDDVGNPHDGFKVGGGVIQLVRVWCGVWSEVEMVLTHCDVWFWD
jgi:hypothetical protein